VSVNTSDLFEDSSLVIDEGLVQSSLDAEHRVMDQWENYLNVGRPGIRSLATRSLRRVRRLQKRVSSPGPAMVRRLLNIEASHVDLLRRGLEIGTDWIIVLEDDAETADLEDCATGLASLLAISGVQPAYINISRSFTPEELGIAHLLAAEPVQTWAGPVPRVVLSSSKPVTNTVCAIAYRAQFVAQLLDRWESMPVTPVVPIDWKLNQALMAMHADGDLGPSDCWLVEPAPIVQQSIHGG
jgi:hypothetical protein